MKIAVIGSNGMLGTAMTKVLRKKGHEVVAIGRKEFDIAKDPFSQFESAVHGADAVINCAAVIKPRIAETPVEQVLKVNSIFPRNLAALCASRNQACIHIATDAVFSGTRGAFTEKDFVNPDDLYAISKCAGETTESMTIRVSIIGEEQGVGRSLLAWAKSQAGKEVKGFLNHAWNGLTTVQLAQACEQILADDLYSRGIFHLHSPDSLSKLRLLALVNEIYELNLRIQPTEAPNASDITLGSIYPLAGKLCKKKIAEQLRELKAS